MKILIKNTIWLIAFAVILASCSKDPELYTPAETFSRPEKAGEVKEDADQGNKPVGDNQATRPTENGSKPVTGPSSTDDDTGGGISDDDDDESDDDKSSKR